MEKLPVTNVFQVMDNELSRMHNLMLATMSARQDPDSYTLNGANLPRATREIYDRISEFHSILLEAVKNHDAKVQEKVAELALTSTK